MSQVLGAFGLLDFTMLRPFSLGMRFYTYEPFIYLVFKFFSDRDETRILITGYGATPIYVYIYSQYVLLSLTVIIFHIMRIK
jgi:predicted branched-subunit amino acid permease